MPALPFHVVCFSYWSVYPTVSAAQIPGATLREQLKSLERLHGVEVRGLERIGDEPARATTGRPAPAKSWAF